MEVILQANIDNLGLRGDIVKVKDGYARNYLLPMKLAVEATEGNLKQMQQQRLKIDALKVQEQTEAEELKASLEKVTLDVARKVGEKGTLYGSVTTMEIKSLLEAKGFEFDKRKIITNEMIKTTGEFEVFVKIHPEVTAALKLNVHNEEDWKETAEETEASPEPVESEPTAEEEAIKAETEEQKETVEEPSNE